MCFQCITRSSSRKVAHSHHSARGESLNSSFLVCHLDTSSEGSWCAACQRRYEDTSKKWQSKEAVSVSHRWCLSRATLMWWVLFSLWCGGAVRLVGLSLLCLLVSWAWQSLWWSSDQTKGLSPSLCSTALLFHIRREGGRRLPSFKQREEKEESVSPSSHHQKKKMWVGRKTKLLLNQSVSFFICITTVSS